MARNRANFCGNTRLSGGKKVFWIYTVVLCLLLFLYLCVSVLTVTDLEKIRFHRRQLTFDTSLMSTHCNISDEKGPSLRKPVDLRVFVLTYNRPNSVHRLLKSLNNAIYRNSSVVLEVWVDRSTSGHVDTDTIQVLKNFVFKHGVYRVCVQSKHAGILGQWLTPWKADESDDHEVAVLLEDDMTVSPHFYTYLKHVHSRYDNNPQVNGFALQGSSMKHFYRPWTFQKNIAVNSKDIVYLYPTLGTWGFSPSRKNWLRFLNWFKYKYADAIFNPLVHKHVSSGWYKKFSDEGSEDHFWEVWHIYFAWANKEFTMYPNFEGHKGLTFNWKENGLHYTDQSVLDEDADKSQLLLEWSPDYNRLPDRVLLVDNDGSILTRLDLH